MAKTLREDALDLALLYRDEKDRADEAELRVRTLEADLIEARARRT